MYTVDTMRIALLLPFALLLGLAIGGWAPKEELRARQRETDDLRKKLSESDKESRSDVFTSLVKIPSRTTPSGDKPHALARAKGRRDAPAPTEGAAPTGAVAAAAAPAAPTADKPATPPKPEDLKARIEEAKELWKTRVDIARAQWIDRLKLNQDGTAQFDESINSMNERLYASMQSVADRLAATDTLTPEDGTRAFNDMTSALVQAYDDLNAIVPEDLRGEVAKTELTDFIDPAVAEPLIAVQDKLEKLPRQKGPRMGLLK